MLAVGLVLVGGRSDVTGFHAVLGWAVVVALALQVLSGWFRGSKGGPSDNQMRGDHYDMNPRRRVFEAFHKVTGFSLVVAAAITILWGL